VSPSLKSQRNMYPTSMTEQSMFQKMFLPMPVWVEGEEMNMNQKVLNQVNDRLEENL
jgi:hypothetical protein